MARSETLREQVLALHRHYNQVAELPQGLPGRRPRHQNHAAKEQRVQEKAREELATAHQLPYAG